MNEAVPAPPPPPPPKKKRRLRRWAAGVLLLAGVAVGVAVPLAGPAVAAGVIRDYVAGHYTGSAETGPISVSWSGRIVVEETRLTPAGGRELARIGRVVLDVNLWEYLRGRGNYVLLIERPTATVAVEPDGRTNLEIFLQPPAPLPDAPLKPTRLDLTVRDGSVDYAGTRLEIPSATYRCENLNAPGALKAELGLAPGGRATVTGSVALAKADRFDPAGRLEVRAEALPVAALPGGAAGRIDGDLALAIEERRLDGSLHLRDLRWKGAELAQADVTIAGTPDRGRATLAVGKTLKATLEAAESVTLTASGDMAELAEILRQPLAVKEGMTLAGTLRAEAVLKRDPIAVTGSIVLSDLAAVDRAGTRAPIEPEVRLDVDARSSGDRLELTKLVLASTPLSASGSAVLAGAQLQDATFDATFDLNLLHQKLATFIEAGALDLGGTVTAKVRTTGGAVTLSARGEKVRAAGLAKPLDFALDGNASVAAGGTTIERLTLTSKPLTLASSGTIRDTVKIDWTATADPAELGAAVGQALAGPPVTMTGTVSGPVDAPVLLADATLESLKVGERVLPKTSLTLKASGTLLDATAAFPVSEAARAFGSTIAGGPGEVKLRLDLSGTAPRIRGSAKAGQVERFGDVTAEFDVDLAVIHRFEARSALGSFSASGAFAGPLSVRGSGDLAALGKGTSGAWTSETAVTQEKGITRAGGTTTIANLALTSADGSVTRRPKITLTHAALLDPVRKRLTLENAELTAPDGTVALKGALSYAADPMMLEELVADLALVMKEGLTVTGRLESDGPARLGADVSGKFVVRNLATRDGAGTSTVVDPEVRLEVTGGDGRWNLTASSKGIKAGGTLQRSGEATLLENLSLVSDAFVVQGSGSLAKELKLAWKATADPAKLSPLIGRPMSGKPLIAEGGVSGPLDSLVARVTGSIESLTTDAWSVSGASFSATASLADASLTSLRLDGPGYLATAGQTAGQLDVTLEVSDLTKAAGSLGSTLKGGRGDGKFHMDRGRVTGNLRVSQVEGYGDVTAVLDVTPGETLTVHRCEARSAAGTLTVTGALPGTLRVVGSGDLAAAGKQVAGKWSVDASVAPDQNLQGGLTIAGFSMTTADGRVLKEDKITVTPAGRLDWSNKVLTLVHARIESAGATGTLNGGVTWAGDRPRLQELRCDLTYVPQKLGILLAPWLPEKLEGAEPSTLTVFLSGPLTTEGLTALLGPSESRFVAALKPHVMYGLRVAGKSEAKVHDGILTMETRTTMNEGAFNSDLRADLRDPGGRKVPSNLLLRLQDVKITEDVTALIEKMHPMFHGTKGSVRGIASGSMTYDYAGPFPLPVDVQAAIRSHLTGRGSMKIRDLAMEGSPFLGTVMGFIGMDPKATNGEFDLPDYTLRDGYVEYAQLTLKLHGNTYGFRGRVYTTGRLHLDMIIPVTDEFARKQPRVAPLLGSAVVVEIRGTHDAPEFGWDKALLEALKRGVKLKLEDELKKKLGDLIFPK